MPRSPTTIAKEYGLADRASIYRHAHALRLFAKRQRNVRAALEKIIEKAGEVDATAAAVVAAVEQMTTAELEAYARDGSLPDWFTQTVGATATDS